FDLAAVWIEILVIFLFIDRIISIDRELTFRKIVSPSFDRLVEIIGKRYCELPYKMIGQENSVRRITPDDIRIHGEKIAKMFQEHFLIELQQLKIKKNTRKMYWDIPYTNVKNLPSPTRLIGFFVSMLVIEFV